MNTIVLLSGQPTTQKLTMSKQLHAQTKVVMEAPNFCPLNTGKTEERETLK
jgi:hypothetical protein